MEIDWDNTSLNWQKLPYEGYEEFQYKNAFLNLRNMFNIALEGKKLNIRRYIDAGANYGLTVPIMYDQCQSIECFEVRSDVFECLEMNIANNNFSEKTRAHNSGLSSREGFAWHTMDAKSGQTRVMDQYTPERKMCSLVTLDSFNFQDVDLIKIDVEGHELEVLKGSKKTIECSRPILIVEATGAVKQKNMFDFFSSVNYTCNLPNGTDSVIVPLMMPHHPKDFICVPNEKDYD